MTLVDNGTPDMDKVSDGSGLENMKMRAKAIGWSIKAVINHGFEIQLQA